MKIQKSLIVAICLWLGVNLNLNAQVKKATAPVKTKPAAGKSFESFPGDPYKARIYTLKNGLKVYMSVYKGAPRLYTMIAVKAGSKNDPADATGLAHYLEHMLFKGTDRFGSLDYSKEEPYINQITNLYETYRKTTNEKERKKLYHVIDSISGVAAKFAIANEYDKMTSSIGCQGTNAFTSFEKTVYVNDIPSNQIENFLGIEAERFRKPVMRLFHTELEAVYEEKNRSLDNDQAKVFEGLFSLLFTNHTYGKQTTIGTIDHLKNPSLVEIMKYYNKHYVPNNMAIVLAGDFDPDQTIKIIENKFSYMQPKPVEPFTFQKEEPITSPRSKEVFGPDAESVWMSWRFDGINSSGADMIRLIAQLLSNGRAGLMDLNLNQSQKVLEAGAFDYALKDYSVMGMVGKPKEGQKLEEVRDLMLSEIKNLQSGNFPDWLIPATITNLKLNEALKLEDNRARCNEMMESFTTDGSWTFRFKQIDRLSKITKQQVIDFSRKYLGDNYVIIYKRKGEDKNVQKVEKPEITPVEVNRNDQSPFLKSVVEFQAKPVEPVWLDFKKDMTELKIKSGVEVHYKLNTENQIFDLVYVFDFGSKSSKVLPVAIEYLKYLGTDKYSAANIQEEFYKLGCTFNVSSNPDKCTISLNGLDEHFTAALKLFEHLIRNAKADKEAFEGLLDEIRKRREDAKLNKNIILRQALTNYAMYGPENPFTYSLSDEELSKLTPEQLIAELESLENFEHHILYYGSIKPEALTKILNTWHATPEKFLPHNKNKEFTEQKTGGTVYVIDYDMKQAEIVMLAKGEMFNKDLLPYVDLYNSYFGGGMSSVVFQELRESRALAYSVSSRYRAPQFKGHSFYLSSYIGSQADKLPEAMAGMSDLLDNMPKSDVMFGASKESYIASLRTERIIKTDILYKYEELNNLGFDYDIRKEIYEKALQLNYDDIKSFQEKYIKGLPKTVLVIGKKEKLDMKTLEKYGTVKFLTLKDVFGY